MKWYNFFTDNGLPVPLIRHRGRGDLVATLAVAFAFIVGLILLFGGSAYHSDVNPAVGLHISIPAIQNLSQVSAAVIPIIATIIGYVAKRGQDANIE